MHTLLRAISLATALPLVVSGCFQPRLQPPARPVAGNVTPAELAVYRTVAESVYVRATAHRVAIASTTMDSTCSGTRCDPITPGRMATHRTALPLGSTPVPPAAELVMRDAGEIRLDRVALGRPRLVVIDADDVPVAAADTSTWRYFRGNYGGIAGVLRFSPIGFDLGGQRATVSVLWRCGPACGHVLNVTLRAAPGEQWEIVDLLLQRSGEPVIAESDQ